MSRYEYNEVFISSYSSMYYTQPDVYEFISKQIGDPIVERKTCRVSGTKFPIFQSDLDFYEKISPQFEGKIFEIPTPSLCPEERQRRRMAWRNEKTLYKRQCDASEKQIISVYRPDSPYIIYDQTERWSDKWNPLDYGQEIDFTTSFLIQFQKLLTRVPRANIVNTNSENSEYTNYTANNKDCYLIFSNSYGGNEKCMYGTMIARSYHCVDAIQSFDCSFCYEIIDCDNCSGLRYSFNCKDCADSRFLKDCIGCHDCIGCYGMRNTSYCIFNKQYSKDDYQQQMDKLTLTTRTGIQQLRTNFDAFVLQFPQKSCEIEESENCTGNIVKYSKNCQLCYDTDHCEDCRYGWYMVSEEKDAYDCSFSGGSDISYECMSLVDCHHTCFSNLNWRGSSDLLYCDNCFGTKHCFGCTGLRNKEYCILNKQYTPEEYEKNVAMIIQKMQHDGEWGEFFPITMSPFAYNETIAQDYFPLEQKEAERLGYRWVEKPEQVSHIPDGSIKGEDLPNTITETNQDICQKIILCEMSKKPFRILPLELILYQKLGIPLPTLHPDLRYQKRLAYRTNIALHLRNDTHTGEEIVSIYPENVSFPVYGLNTYEQIEF